MSHDPISAGARQFQRHATQFRARIEPHPDQAEQFRLCYSVFSDDLAVVDVSAGGIALHSCFFVPRNLRMAVTILDLKTADGRQLGDVTVRAVVRRCLLVDYKPTYQVGMQFIDPTGTDEQMFVQVATDAGALSKPVQLEAAGAR
jgi:hypothetical protein